MTIYTRRGDRGDTSLVGGDRVSKASARVEAYGAVDEAGSAVGFARAALTQPDLDSVLLFAQQRLFNCSSSLATPLPHVSDSTPRISAEDVAALESAIDVFTERTAPQTGFVVGAGSEAGCRLQLARAITRRAERRIVTLTAQEPVDEFLLSFVNRLSDALFASARYADSLDGSTDEPWDPHAPRPGLRAL